MYKGQRGAETRSFHLFLGRDIKLRLNLEAVTEDLIFIVLLITLQTANHVDVSIQSLEGLGLDGELLRDRILDKLFQLEVKDEAIVGVLFANVQLSVIILSCRQSIL